MKLEVNEYKSFTLRKDPDTKRPARIVLDITADKRTAPTNVAKGTTDKPTAKVSSEPAAKSDTPVVGNKPTANSRKKPPEVGVSLKGNVSAPTVSVSIGGGSVDSPKDKKALEKEMSHSDFCYMALGEVESLILEDRIHKKRVNKNI